MPTHVLGHPDVSTNALSENEDKRDCGPGSRAQLYLACRCMQSNLEDYLKSIHQEWQPDFFRTGWQHIYRIRLDDGVKSPENHPQSALSMNCRT